MKYIMVYNQHVVDYYYYYEEFTSWCHKQPRRPIIGDTPQGYSRYVFEEDLGEQVVSASRKDMKH